MESDKLMLLSNKSAAVNIRYTLDLKQRAPLCVLSHILVLETLKVLYSASMRMLRILTFVDVERGQAESFNLGACLFRSQILSQVHIVLPGCEPQVRCLHPCC